MNILYVSKLCSKAKFNELYKMLLVKPQQQAQKFHWLLATGFAQNDNIRVTTLSGLPISRVNTKKIWWKSSSDKEKGVSLNYLPHINLPFLGCIFTIMASIYEVFKWIKKSKDEKVIICDVLNLTVSMIALIMGKLLKIKTVAIVTDIPGFMHGYSNKRQPVIQRIILNIYIKLSSFMLQRYDSYVILTEQMNALVNPKKRPYVVIEGMVDHEMENTNNNIDDKFQEKVIIYAGALQEKYGVKKLVDALMKVEIKDARLWLFGSGELEEYIRKCEKLDDRIKFFGVVPNSVVVEKEIRATLLVNPRPSDEEFTKYSFPSKNMEYMVSGTPVLTTPLPGMPFEYNKHVYSIKSESIEGIKNELTKVLYKNQEDLFKKGESAKAFVLRNKNNIVQGMKIINLVKMGA